MSTPVDTLVNTQSLGLDRRAAPAVGRHRVGVGGRVVVGCVVIEELDKGLDKGQPNRGNRQPDNRTSHNPTIRQPVNRTARKGS